MIKFTSQIFISQICLGGSWISSSLAVTGGFVLLLAAFRNKKCIASVNRGNNGFEGILPHGCALSLLFILLRLMKFFQKNILTFFRKSDIIFKCLITLQKVLK